MRYTSAAVILLVILLSACSSTQEQVKMVPPEKDETPKIVPPEPEREFTFNERYFVRDAAIGDPKDVDDPLQAIRVIQLQKGSNQVLVISSFDKVAGEAMETWLGVEMPSFKPGTYKLAKATRVMFYRFFLGEERKRIDGEAYEGTITIEEEKDGYLIGYIDATINGLTRSFQEDSKKVRVRMTGSFHIQEVELENTMMKSR